MAVVTALCVGVTYAAMPVTEYRVDAQGTPVVMTVNGDPIHANEYAAYMVSSKMTYDSQLAQYAQFGLDISSMMNGEDMLDSIRSDTKSVLTQYHVIVQKFKENGLKLNGIDTSEMEAYKKSMQEQLGGKEAYLEALGQQGLTDQMYHNSLLVSLYAQALNNYYFGDHGVLVPPEDELSAYYNENYYQAKHVLIKTQDENGTELSGDALAEKKALADEIYQRAKDGEDFDGLVQQYSEDFGMAAQGYIFKEGDMVDEFYNATKATEENGISEPVKSDYGFHIIQRLPLDQESQANYKLDMVAAISGEDFNTLMQKWVDEAKVETVDDEINKITLDNMVTTAIPGSDAQPEDGQDGNEPDAPADGAAAS